MKQNRPTKVKFEAWDGSYLEQTVPEIVTWGAEMLEDSVETDESYLQKAAGEAAGAVREVGEKAQRRTYMDEGDATQLLWRLQDRIDEWWCSYQPSIEIDGTSEYGFDIRRDNGGGSRIGYARWDQKTGKVEGEVNLLGIKDESVDHEELQRELRSSIEYWGPGGGQVWEYNPLQRRLEALGEQRK